jgi:hypothetical protein
MAGTIAKSSKRDQTEPKQHQRIGSGSENGEAERGEARF